MTESVKENKNTTILECINPFEKLDENTLETIFILSGNPEISTLSIKFFRVAHYIPTQVKYLKRNIYARPEFAQSVFYPGHPKLAKKEELVIELLKQEIDIDQGGKNSIYNRIFKHKMNDALYTMLRMFKLEKITYTPGSGNKIEPYIFRNNEYYIVKSLMEEKKIKKIVEEFELYKDENIETLLILLDIRIIRHDLVKGCGISEEGLFLKEKRKVYI
ncbi:hypothetical protein BB559_001953 [Furculomyces boomerangus]|uniref:Uncharacterized protein n=1 Tax=Furculomyces boomerangus TaxID=61424 RepID=A0A2T9YZB8_9FUNG|nr:hypothetical protein BB559_001953 [Furculomyces boomerangus]